MWDSKELQAEAIRACGGQWVRRRAWVGSLLWLEDADREGVAVMVIWRVDGRLGW